MAHALEADPVNQLEEILECSVCLKPLKDPRTLPCFHSFCKVCLEGVVKTRRDQTPRGRPIRQFHCPNCREEFTLEPDKEVADMRPNHFICNLVQAIGILNRGIGVPCSNNCSKSLSIAYCVNCEKFLCASCLTAHNNYRGHDGHSVLTMEELSKPENRMKIKGKMYCKAHQDEPLKIYCETCDQLICRDCMDFKHARENHSCLLVNDVANNYKELLHSSNNAMINALNKSNELLNSLTQTTEQLDFRAKNAKANIVRRKEEMTKKVLEILNQQTQKRLNEVEQIHKDERAKLDTLIKDTEHYAESMQRSVQLSKKIVDQGTEEEITSSQKMMLENAKKLLARRGKHFNAPIPKVELIYTARTANEPSNEEISRLMAKSLGAVRKQNKDIAVELESESNAKGVTCSSGNTPPLKLSSYLTTVTWSAAPKGTDTTTPGSDPRSSNDKDECSICLSDFTDKKTLDKCGHSFCAACIKGAFKIQKKCPVCFQVYGPLTGNQPDGKMIDSFQTTRLPGYTCGTIGITYIFEKGIQGANHPNPGQPYPGTRRHAYLPVNEEGRKVLRLLKKAFEQKLTFTIGRSSTSGADNVITWNDIHHKTNRGGGPTRFGYPDPDYLKRVQEELAAKGITE